MERKTSICLALPGEIFSRRWVIAYTNLLLSGFAGNYDIAPLFGFASSPHVTRGALAAEILNSPTPIDYVLWVDDDNIVEPAHLNKLLGTLQRFPGIDLSAGWCWIEGDKDSGRAARVSCGMWAKGHSQQSFSHEAMKVGARNNHLMVANWTGFPCVLMRADALRKTGPHPFAGIPGDEFLHGMSGEDIGFCIRAEQAGLKLVVDPAVKVEHLKTRPVDDPPELLVIDLGTAPAKRAGRSSSLPAIKFSVCHTSARPDKWRLPWLEYGRKASGARGDFEYVLCADQRWGFDPLNFPSAQCPDLLTWNLGRRCAVDGWNEAFRVSTGDVLIMGADDFFPPENWDSLLSDAIGDLDPRTQDFAVRVNTPNPNQGRGLYALIISRARYERLGYALYSEYDCMFSDDDYCEHIAQDVADGKTILIDARHIMFGETNPTFSGAEWDEVYKHQNRPEAYQMGRQILERRRAARFEKLQPLPVIDLAGAQTGGNVQ